MGKHTARNISLVVALVAIVGAGTGLFLFQGEEFEFNLPVQARLLTSQELQGFDPIEAPFGASFATGITCKVKQTTIVIGVNQNNQIVELARIESSGLGGSPFALLAISSTTTPQGNVLSHFQVEPKIFCSTAGDLPIEVFVKQLTATTFGSFTTVATGSVAEVLQRQNVFSSPLLMFGQGQPEQRLNQFIIKATDLEKGLPDVDFSVLYTFDITGIINVNYRDFPAITYQIPIGFGDLDTEFTVNVDKARTVIDTDGDGIPDNVDLCPLSPEDFDNFEDGDGCPETGTGQMPPPPVCLFGEILQNNVCVEDCRVTGCVPMTCAEGNTQACEQECIDSGGQLLIIQGVLTCLNVPECTQNEDLILRNGNEFVCVPKVGTGDRDGDGIIDALDQCPDLREDLDGFEDEDGCPEAGTGMDCPTGQIRIEGVCVPKPSEGNLIEKVLEGDIVTLTTIRFEDNTVETAIASTSGASIQTPNLFQQISELVPAELIGTIQEGEGKPIDEISIEIFYINNVRPELIGVRSSMLDLILTVDESTVSMASSMPIPFIGGIGDGKLSPLSGEVGLLGTGISLGIVRVTAENIVNLGEEANITTGQKKDANLIFSMSGFITFNDGDERERFLLTNSIITIKSVDIDNQGIPPAPIVCTPSQLEIIDPRTGVVTGCTTPPPTAPKCFSSERPQPVGYACTPQDIINFCDGDPTSCTEKDDDRDGIPNYRDDCRDVTKNNLLEDGLTINGSDPNDGCSAIKKGVTCNPLIQQCKPEPPELPMPMLCSEENPEKCLFGLPPSQLETFLIIGGVGLLIVGVLVFAFRRRRSRVFGA